MCSYAGLPQTEDLYGHDAMACSTVDGGGWVLEVPDSEDFAGVRMDSGSCFVVGGIVNGEVIAKWENIWRMEYTLNKGNLEVQDKRDSKLIW